MSSEVTSRRVVSVSVTQQLYLHHIKVKPKRDSGFSGHRRH